MPDDDDAPNSDVGVDVAAEHERLDDALDGLNRDAAAAGTSVWSETLSDDGTTRQRAAAHDFGGRGHQGAGRRPDLRRPPEEAAGARSVLGRRVHPDTGWRWDRSCAGTSAPARPRASSTWTRPRRRSRPRRRTSPAATTAAAWRTRSGRRTSTSGARARPPTSTAAATVSRPTGSTWSRSATCPEHSGDRVRVVLRRRGQGGATVQLNKADHDWTTNPGAASCSEQFSVKAVMTHERGHTFGLGHVGRAATAT